MAKSLSVLPIPLAGRIKPKNRMTVGFSQVQADTVRAEAAALGCSCSDVIRWLVNELRKRREAAHDKR